MVGDHYCSCHYACDLTQQHHDWLLRFEERDLPGFIELWAYLGTDAASEPVDGTLPREEFERFVAQHNWQSPTDVYDFADWVTTELRAREKNFAAKDMRLAS